MIWKGFARAQVARLDPEACGAVWRANAPPSPAAVRRPGGLVGDSASLLPFKTRPIGGETVEVTSSAIALRLAVGHPELSEAEGFHPGKDRTPSYVNYCWFLLLSFPAPVFGLCSAPSFIVPVR